ncbi:hypothetical protein B4071_3835 [Bacillus subtilis]|uniref:Uncharacterized protein n=1 Tax=Bacillus subtilis subsp. subtilis TaxID=135461 RepID=A0ABD3ZVX4_BACIU|nr:hypothetical protein B4067_4232 [Bacillus subtilis subsp. subtilis]KIN34620.1 hypothetical protein B4070_3911 [Bacillus subtilis]KIN40756.1 hypothetical protein B4071_3835 [Bacillus subtilis]KIN57554.1 hypothetical protein B4145_4121 [Bacillus subtilis]
MWIQKLVRILHDDKGESNAERNWRADFFKALTLQPAKKTMR